MNKNINIDASNSTTSKRTIKNNKKNKINKIYNYGHPYTRANLNLNINQKQMIKNFSTFFYELNESIFTVVYWMTIDQVYGRNFLLKVGSG